MRPEPPQSVCIDLVTVSDRDSLKPPGFGNGLLDNEWVKGDVTVEITKNWDVNDRENIAY